MVLVLVAPVRKVGHKANKSIALATTTATEGCKASKIEGPSEPE